MPNTVTNSFKLFRESIVDLDTNQTTLARTSRDYLVSNLKDSLKNSYDLPNIYSGLFFESFDRRTKIKPLDDIDILILLNDEYTDLVQVSYNCYELRVSNYSSPLRYSSENNIVNSTKLLNKIKAKLEQIPRYKSPAIHRRGVAVSLSLVSYPWTFDIVPAFPVFYSGYIKTVLYYIIPDGNGKWMRTDPRIDQENVTKLNSRHNGLFLPLVRLIKYWNTNNPSTCRIPSYYLETLIMMALEYEFLIPNLQVGIRKVFEKLKTSIMNPCPDPKKLGVDLSYSATRESRIKFSEVCQEMDLNAYIALDYEKQNNHSWAIHYWSKIFPNFPQYGS